MSLNYSGALAREACASEHHKCSPKKLDNHVTVRLPARPTIRLYHRQTNVK